ncbi:MAG TPA: hypothetical protein VFI65_09045 [Streptosporangiaceae bacterium]|nr:hypothetical protein [Streptosporangiaceae bacterium]
MGRDVGRDEGRDQAAWRDLVSRLELMSPIDPADAPWPDRENLPAKPASNATKQFTADDLLASSEAAASDTAAAATAASDATATISDKSSPLGQTKEAAEVTDGETTAPTVAIEPADSSVKQAEPGRAPDAPGPAASEEDDSPGAGSGADTKRDNRPDRRPPVTRSRIIRPASYPRFGRAIPRQAGPSAHDQDAARTGGPFDPLEGTGSAAGPRDFELADDSVFDFGDDDRYIPPPLPPMGGVDPVAAFGWTALFGGPAYLLISMLADWQNPRWMALAAVIAFVAGFIVLVFRLGDGPSKRDGPDQGAVV